METKGAKEQSSTPYKYGPAGGCKLSIPNLDGNATGREYKNMDMILFVEEHEEVIKFKFHGWPVKKSQPAYSLTLGRNNGTTFATIQAGINTTGNTMKLDSLVFDIHQEGQISSTYEVEFDSEDPTYYKEFFAALAQYEEVGKIDPVVRVDAHRWDFDEGGRGDDEHHDDDDDDTGEDADAAAQDGEADPDP